MHATWRQVLAGSVAAVIVSSLGFVAARERAMESDRTSTMPSASPGEGQTTPWQDFLITQGRLLSLELGPPLDWEPAMASRLSESIQADRVTVLEADRSVRR
jgi:hypothetical protein